MSEKQFDPTPQRRERFRKDGRFARSRDANGLAATAAALGTLLGTRGAMSDAVHVLFQRTLGDLDALARGDWDGAKRAAITALVTIAAPCAVFAAGAATTIGVAQAGFRIDFGNVGFKPQHFDPLGRLKNIFSPKQGAIETLMSLLRVGAVGWVAYRAALLDWRDLLELGSTPLEAASARLVSSVVHVVTSVLGALLVVAAIDYAQSRFRLEGEMRMTRQEMKEEMSAQEGDQKVKGRMRARARALARKRAIANVKKADVVIANPTHVAVALRYGKRDPAPVVVAKGHDEVALQIRTEARKHGIPVLENRKLARALDAEVPIGHAIPAAHFAAVARVLAFVYKLRGNNAGTRRA
jgi:flagellar biosynthetic protein FlhB